MATQDAYDNAFHHLEANEYVLDAEQDGLNGITAYLNSDITGLDEPEGTPIEFHQLPEDIQMLCGASDVELQFESAYVQSLGNSVCAEFSVPDY